MTKSFGFAAFAIALVLVAPSGSFARPAGQDCDAVQSAVQTQIEAACPCDAAAAHADHVRCVTKKLRELSSCAPDANGKRSCGSIPRACVPGIRRIASRSACGKPAENVTCCVPKQRDCAGDEHPGDGQQDGTCTGTRSKKKCDRVTDCLVPKCEVAASAEVCDAIGGTVGTGRDCSTACPE
jgi:hypothetical protein